MLYPRPLRSRSQPSGHRFVSGAHVSVRQEPFRRVLLRSHGTSADKRSMMDVSHWVYSCIPPDIDRSDANERSSMLRMAPEQRCGHLYIHGYPPTAFAQLPDDAMLPILLAILATPLALASPTANVGFFDPTANGGSWLDNAGDGLGEPMNVVISGLSSPGVLTDDGIINFARAIGFSTECLDIHLGAPQSANLGDGNGFVNQTIELRQDFGDPELGTCEESLTGGNHFRVFRQNGTQANSGALFLAVSKEEDIFESHTIAPDGYDQGRDALVQAAVGTTSFNGVTYSTTSETLEGVMVDGSTGVNHDIAIDGNAVLLTVQIDN
ncbi:hypothetical protein NM688_g2171 [Phlebia brevispora]|uniref:Uncharacterized protein n=1 Tax=Phlebia brevispora TaxID=194682 RepID=A0ACC1T9L0_9APHY|nr:hypothetical protein NM688_g2171 [Phlebia brevispora]